MRCGCSENGFGLKIVGGQALPWAKDQLGAYVAGIYPGSVADRLHGELQEGASLHYIAICDFCDKTSGTVG